MGSTWFVMTKQIAENGELETTVEAFVLEDSARKAYAAHVEGGRFRSVYLAHVVSEAHA